PSRGGHRVATHPQGGPPRPFNSSIRQPGPPRGPGPVRPPLMRPFGPPGRMAPPRGMRPPFFGQQPPPPPFFGAGSRPPRPSPRFDAPPPRPKGRQLLSNPPHGNQPAADQIQPTIVPESEATVKEVPEPDTAVAAAGQLLEESDDVVSLFGGSDFGDNENNAINNDENGPAESKQLEQNESSDAKQQQEQQSSDSKKQREPAGAKPADLRAQLAGQAPRRGGGGASGGGLLPRPSAGQQQPPGPLTDSGPVASRVLLQKPPPQQVPHNLHPDGAQPPNKRSRTLLEQAPVPIGSLVRGRGGHGNGIHQGARGAGRGRGGGGSRGGGSGGSAGFGAAQDGGIGLVGRTLLPTPDSRRGEIRPLLGDSNIESSSSSSYLSLPPAVTRSGAGLLQTPDSAAVPLLPAPAPNPSSRAPLLSAPDRTQVLPVPRQVEASADSLRVSLLNSQESAAPVSTAQSATNFSSTAIAAYPSDTDAGFGSSSSYSAGLGGLGDTGLLQLGRPRLLQQPQAVKTEAEMRAELTEAFKSQQFERGYELLRQARAAYPHEFTDLVVYEVVEYCASKKEALEVCVLTARLISEPNVKLLELLADLAEKNPAQLRSLTDELWLVFNNVLTLQPDATAMMAFIRCFSSLKSWTKVWGAVDRFAPMQIIPIEGFIFCLEALVNGNASEFVNLGIGLLSNMDPQNLQQVGLELVERLWLRCALDGSTENVGRIEQIRAIFHLTPTQQTNFLNRIRVKVTELVMGNDFDTLCRFFSSVSNLEVLSEFVIDAFHVAEDPQAKFELLSKAIDRSRNPAMEAFISQTAVRLLKKSVDRMQWADALRLLRSLRGLNISLMKAVSATQPDMSEAYIANMAFQIYMRTQSYSTAASMLSADTSPIGIALPATGEHASARFQLLHELCTACIAEGTLADAAAALNAMMQHPVSRSSELNKVYNDFLAACCEASSDDLKLGVEIIPKAHQSSLVISATVLRMLLCASFKHGMKAQAKEYLMLGTKVGIYPVVSVSCPGPKTVQLQSDLSKDEIHVILTNLFVKLKKYLMESLQSRELDVIQECTIKLTALGVGNRDPKFIEVHKIQSNEQAVLQRASEILQTPNNFQSVVSVRFLSENGVNVLKLDGTMVYQCVYYVDEDWHPVH
uniref:MI domain-containing protein n=1 Tax=Macrostomum lignano TaxID=282301 RepID=A0A1I8HVL8_9PLAT